MHKHLKFSDVNGTTSALNSISIRPLADPPMVMSKNTTGLLLASVAAELMVRLYRSVDYDFTVMMCTLL